MWRYKIAFTNKESKVKATEELAKLNAEVYSNSQYIIVESADHMWDEVMPILDSIHGYSLFREYYD